MSESHSDTSGDGQTENSRPTDEHRAAGASVVLRTLIVAVAVIIGLLVVIVLAVWRSAP